MTSTRKMLLGTAAATMAVSGGVSTEVQAADAVLKKAPPVQYVRICDRYGYGFFQIPGSSICLQLRGQVQSDNAYQGLKDIAFVGPSKSTGLYGGSSKAAIPAGGAIGNATVQFANQQDAWGYEVTAKPRFDARTETSMGTLRAYAEIKIALDTGNFAGCCGPGGPGGSADFGAGTKTENYRTFLQWAGWTIGNADSIWSGGNYKTGDIANVAPSDKSSGWTVFYTWTPSGPGAPPVKGSAPVPDGWSLSFGADTPTKHIAKQQVGGGCTYYDLALAVGSPAGSGSVCAQTGPLSVPDFVARVHYEADPPGKDDQHNDQFGLGTFHVAGIYHQITEIVQGTPILGAGGADPLLFPGNCGLGAACAFGPPLHDHGWGVTSFVKFFVPMLPGTKLGANGAANADNLQFQFNYCEAALEPCGVGAGNGNLSSGDAYWTGGLARDDMDVRTINNGVGGFYNDKEKIWVFNAQYHAFLTDCTDPVKCFVLTLEFNNTAVTPGNITQNVDWTNGGLGKANFQAYTAEISWGTTRNGTTKPVWWRLDSEVQYRVLNQTLPCNNNGNTAIACGLPTAVPTGQKDAFHVKADSWVYRATITMNW
jgi:Porin subfamily